MSKGQETKQMIIEKSAPIFMVKGIAATAMSDVIKATGLSKGTIYIHFENKEDLAQTVVQYNLDLLRNKGLGVINKDKSAYINIMAFLNMLSNPLQTPVPGGCPMLNFGMEVDDTNEVIKKIVSEMVINTQHLIASILKKGIDDGEFKSEWDYQSFSTAMFAMIEGAIMICRITDSNIKMKVVVDYIKGIIDSNKR